MGARALSVLLFVGIILLVVLGWLTAKASKTISTDVVTPTPYGEYQSIVLRKSKYHEEVFFEYHPSGTQRSCVSWWTDRQIEVYYQVTRDGAGFQGLQWHQYGVGTQWHFNGRGNYRYRFVRLSDQPVQIVFHLTGSPKTCGFRGYTSVLPAPATPIDVFTDLIGLQRMQSSYDISQIVRVGTPSRPSTRPTQRSRTNQTKPKTARLFEPLRPKAQPAPQQRTPVIHALPPKSTAYWRQVVQRQTFPAIVDLTPEEWKYVEQRFSKLGLWEGNRQQAIRRWQQASGDQSSSVLNVRQFKNLMLGGNATGVRTSASGKVLPRQNLKLSREQWRQVQRRLNQLGFGAGAADGVVGAKTVAAIRAFERSVGLSQDGVLTRYDYRKLMR